jgi:hypothetical protein
MRVNPDEASRTSESVPRGRPGQQVGDRDAAGLDVNRLTEIGVSPSAPEFVRIDSIDGPKSLATALARLNLPLNDLLQAGAGGCPK